MYRKGFSDKVKLGPHNLLLRPRIAIFDLPASRFIIESEVII